MCIFNTLLDGFTAIFNPSARKRSPEMDRLDRFIQGYQQTSDQERLSQDWRAVYMDMGRAWKKLQASYGKE